MARPIVHDLHEVFEERNLFLLVALGMVSFAQSLREIVVSSSMIEPREDVGAGSSSDAQSQEAVLHLLLGVASFSESALDVLARVRADVESAPAVEPAGELPDPITLRSLLA